MEKKREKDKKNEDEGLFVDDFLHFAVQEYTALLDGFFLSRTMYLVIVCS